MTIAELAQLIISIATLIGAIGSLYVSLQTKGITEGTHALVNGQSEQINALREARGHAQGVAETRETLDIQATKNPPAEPRGS